ncbi:MAG: ABC transporter permease [Candidatus Saccharibacteria bacterium]
MKYQYIIKLAFKNLFSRKLRTFLTILGVSISVGFICILMAFSYGMQKAATDQIANGETLKNIDVSKGSSKIVELDNNTINDISDFSEVDKVYPQVALAGDAQLGESKSNGVVYGADNDLLNIIKPKIIGGQIYGQYETDKVVVNVVLANKLTNNSAESILNKTIDIRLVLGSDLFSDKNINTQIKTVKATVTGLVDDGKTAYMFVPLKTVTDLGVSRYSSLKVQMKSVDSVDQVKSQIEFMGFKVGAVKDTVDQVNQFFQVFQTILIIVGAISIIVATLGIFNTMTISLIEKTREVGLMKIMGVKKVYIRRIFLTESLVIGLSGGILGIASSILIGQGVNYTIYNMAASSGNATTSIMYFPLLLIVAVLIVSVIVSLLAGLYPAVRTTRISPLDALRYE